jgi:hypothetical protein
MEEARQHGASSDKLQRFQRTLDDLKSGMTEAERAQIVATREQGAVNRALQQSQTQLENFNKTLARLNLRAGVGAGIVGAGALGPGDGTAFEEYPWEGHSSNYGPKGNRLGEGYGVGLGVVRQANTGARFGDWVRVGFADGTSVVRQVNETSSRANGVEFYTSKRGEWERHGKVQSVEKVGSPQSSINVTNNFTIQALDHHGVDVVLREHGHKIAAHVRRSFRDSLSDDSVV